MIGHVVLLRTGLASGILKLTTSTSMPQVFTRQLTMFVGIVSPSAVWYTSWLFVRSGWVNLDHNSLRRSGHDGYNWSSSVKNYGVGTWDAKAYKVNYDSLFVYPSHNDGRWHGLPVRCLV